MAITLTAAAATELNRLMGESNLDALRVGVRGGGCSGFNYTLGLCSRENDCTDVDQVFESHDITIVCDPKSFLYLNGVQVDFEESLMGRGFKFNNPNASRTCGCGESFGV